MPFYDLKCTKCGHEFNVMAKMSEREGKLIKCPQSQDNQLEAVFKSVNIVSSRSSEKDCPNRHVCGGCCGH